MPEVARFAVGDDCALEQHVHFRSHIAVRDEVNDPGSTRLPGGKQSKPSTFAFQQHPLPLHTSDLL